MADLSAPGVYVDVVPSLVRPIAGVGTSTAGFIGVVSESLFLWNRPADRTKTHVDAKPGEAVLCTSFGDFSRVFGDFSTDPGQSLLAHAVYGFFDNGGTRCYIASVKAADADLTPALAALASIDEIAIVAAPGMTTIAVHAALTTHCTTMADRFAILDLPPDVADAGALDVTRLTTLELDGATGVRPAASPFAATYYPWIQVDDPASVAGKGQPYFVAPSGHIAGIYARVDAERGVHKAPANESIRGALGLQFRISRAQQGVLNPKGVNAIRHMNGRVLVWGARTLADESSEWKYVNVQRLFTFLRESIEEGTNWVVFEPNDTRLWAKITRNVTAFLTSVWRDGALLGDTPQEAFYVKCDAETNPPSLRDLGEIHIEVGVAIVRPAEFVYFSISQWSGPGGQG